MKQYVQYGCGHSAPEAWINFDVSPTLRIQKTPLLGSLLKKQLNTKFPPNVRFGDIVKGLPVEADSCDGLYCSHVLEHLSLRDFKTALKNSFTILKRDGIFRCVVPDLEFAARNYIRDLENGNKLASEFFIGEGTLLGIEKRPRGFKNMISSLFGNSHHLWMWDHASLSEELRLAGFREIRNCNFNDCPDEMFRMVESEGRFGNAVAIECKK
jgi:hypothetical protein